MKKQHDGWFHHLERSRAFAPHYPSLPEYSILIIQKDIIPNVDDPLTLDPKHKSEETRTNATVAIMALLRDRLMLARRTSFAGGPLRLADPKGHGSNEESRLNPVLDLDCP